MAVCVQAQTAISFSGAAFGLLDVGLLDLGLSKFRAF
jgi:hypothetical protein